MRQKCFCIRQLCLFAQVNIDNTFFFFCKCEVSDIKLYCVSTSTRLDVNNYTGVYLAHTGIIKEKYM